MARGHGRTEKVTKAEKKARRWHMDENMGDAQRLPVRTKAGKWLHPLAEQTLQPAEDSVVGEPLPLSSQASAAAEKTVEQVRGEMAEHALALIESPEEHAGTLRALVALAGSEEHQTRQLGLLTCTAVFKDILPGYSVRPLTEEEKGAKVSKEVQALRGYEQTLVASYRAFLDLVQRSLESGLFAVRFVALTALCELLKHASHFNCFDDIAKWVAHVAVGSDVRLVEKSCAAIESVFGDDQHGFATMLIVRALSDLVKKRGYDASPRIVQTLLAVCVKGDAAPVAFARDASAKPKKHLSKRGRKEWRAQQQEARQAVEAEARVSREEIQRWHGDILRHVLRVYFGVLKHPRNPLVLQQVLKGLVRFAPLISPLYFADLLGTLRGLTEGQMDTECALQCVLTVARVHGLQDKQMGVDIKFMYVFLFGHLGRVCEQPSLLPLLRECFDAVLNPKLALPAVRLAAFAQRLADLAAGSTAQTCAALLALLGDLVQGHSKLHTLLEKETVGGGTYAPNSADPDLAHPFSRSLCQPLRALAEHGDRQVRSLATKILEIKPL